MKQKAIQKSILYTWLLCFPLTAIAVAVYRFPIPFEGYTSGVMAIPKAVTGLIFYTLLGGFIVIPVLGAFAGILGYKMGGENKKQTLKWSYIFSTLFALSIILLLTVLDKIIGEW